MFTDRLLGLRLVAAALLFAGSAVGVAAQTRPRSLGEVDVPLFGLAAGVDPLNPIVPKQTPSGLRIVVGAGGRALSSAEVASYLGGAFQVQAELSGPGLPATVSLPLTGAEAIPSPDPLILTFPGLARAGQYEISNIRLVRNGRSVLDVVPHHVTLTVIEQILVTAVTTRSLTLDEIRQRGILLDPRSYLGFEFAVTLRLESTPIRFTFPVVFDRQGVSVPLPVEPPPEPLRSVISPPLLVPVLMKPAPPTDDPDGSGPQFELEDLKTAAARIPSLLVFPGSAHYLKQFFSVQLLVGNGAPGVSPLVVDQVQGTLHMPPGPDGIPGNDDDPLGLPDTEHGPQSLTVDVRTDSGASELLPGQFGRAELTLRGDHEGTHALEFDLAAMLRGLPTGPVALTGHAHGAVLVRNAYFNTTFTVPTVVRADEEFSLFATLTNVGQGKGQDVKVTIDGSRLSGAELLSPGTQTIDLLSPGDSRTLEYRFKSLVTGEVVASYLRFDTNGGVDVTGRLNFMLQVGERRVAQSPDTLVLPSSVKALPSDVVRAAMRLLGHAWSAATADTLPPGVERPARTSVFQKGLAVAEAGLRVQLGQPLPDALRDLLLDFHGRPIDPGFDQAVRQTSAGRDFDRVLGSALQAAVQEAGGAVGYEETVGIVAASGPPFVSFAAENAGGGDWPADVTLVDGTGGRLELDGAQEVATAVLVRAGAEAGSGRLGWIAAPDAAPYTLQVDGKADGAIHLSFTFPGGNGAQRARLLDLAVRAGSHARLTFDPSRPEPLRLERDIDGDGIYAPPETVATSAVDSTGPRLIAATTIGPETIDGASPFGVYAALLFDRVVSADDAARVESYEIVNNSVLAAQRQLSGRIVFVALEQPEGPLVSTRLAVQGIRDERGQGGERQEVPLTSRLVLPGAVVGGRVLQADGTPVVGAVVTYTNSAVGHAEGQWDCYSGTESAVAAQRTDASGRYELRYVSQSACGAPFRIETQDPQTGAVRGAKTYVRTDGQHLVVDLVLIGSGTVIGTVHQADGRPAAGARVRVVSVTDSQIGGVTNTDADGRYRVPGITVGAVTVTAVSGANLGRGAGRLDNAGGTTTVDLTLDGNVSLTGVVRKLENRVLTPVPGVDVVYYRDNVPFGVSVTDSQGHYRLSGVPAGPYRLEAGLNVRDRTSVGGNNVAGQSLTQDLVIEIREDSNYGSVHGTVRRRDGQVVPGAWVSDNIVAVRADELGRYELAGVTLSASPQQVQAVSPDGRRSGSTSVLVSVPGQVVEGADIEVSGLGTAAFQVVDAQGQPVAGAAVGLMGNCYHPCGCRFTTTNTEGVASFRDVAFGAVQAQAVTQLVPGRSDAASGTTSVTSEDIEGGGIIRFGGFGTVTGIVRNPNGTPAHGASVVLSAQRFVSGGGQCGLTQADQFASTDESGRFQFSNVHVGWVQVRAASTLFPNSVASSQTLAADGAHVDFDLTLSDTLGGVLSGTVFLPVGAGTVGAGVEVTASGPVPDITVHTTEDGSYAFAPILPAGFYALSARDTRPDGTGSLARTFVYLQPGQPARHDITLKARGTVRVTVVDGNGAPVEGAVVHLRVQENDFPYRSYQGTINSPSDQPRSFPDVFEGGVSVEASDNFGRGGRASTAVPPTGQDAEVKVQLTTIGRVTGRFLWADGTTPIPFGTVRLIVGAWVIGQQTTAGEGQVGTFSFDYVPAGPITLQAEDPRSGRTGVATGTLVTEGQVLSLDVTAYAVGRVEGNVTLNDHPVSSPEVSLQSGSYSVRVTADGAGHYAVDGVPAGQVYARADLGGGFLAGSAQGALHGEGQTLNLPIPLRGAGTIAGRLLAPDGVSPGAVSLVTLSAPGSTQTTTTDAMGAFRFDLVPEGSVQLQVGALSSIDCARRSLTVPADETVEVDLRLAGVGALEGTVRDAAGPVGGYLSVTGKGPGCTDYTWSLTVGPAGTFRIPQLLAGPASASFRTSAPNGPPLYASGSTAVLPEQTAQIALQVEPSGRVRGRVLHENGQPALGALVRIDAASWRTSTVQTGSDGSFLAEGIPAGPITIRVTHAALGGVAIVTGTVVFDNNTFDVGDVGMIETPLAATSATPSEGLVEVPVTTAVQLTFNAPLVHAGGLSVRAGGDYLGFGVAFSPDQRTVTLTPWGAGWPDSREILVEAGGGVTDVYGRHPPQVFARRFSTVDLSPPHVATVAPVNGAIQIGGSTTVRVTFDEPIVTTVDLASLLQVTLDGAAVAGTVSATGPSVLTFTPASAWASNSVYRVSANGAADVLGHVQTTAFASSFMTTDTTPPTLRLQSPPAWTRERRPTIGVLVSDAFTGPNTLRAGLSLDGKGVPIARAADYISYVPITNLADGLHTVQASSEDRAGNRGDLSASFRVDTQPPGPAQILVPGADQVVVGTATLTATATDDASGVASISFLSDGTAVATATAAQALSTPWNTPATPDGPHILTARATDVAGNVGLPGAGVRVIVNNLPIGVQIASPRAGRHVGDSVVVAAVVSEPAARVEFLASTGALVVDDSAPFSATFDLTAVPEGDLTVTVTAIGYAPESAVATRSFVVDHTPPPPPDPTRIHAEATAASTLVLGVAGAVESAAQVDAVNAATGATGQRPAAFADGSFALRVPGLAGEGLWVRATDEAGNRSDPTAIVIEGAPAQPEPIPLDGLLFWSRAEEGVVASAGGGVSKWSDQSGVGNHLQQPAAGQQPTLVRDVPSRRDVLGFDGANDWLAFPTNLYPLRTVFFVLREDEDAAGRRALLGEDGWFFPNPTFYPGESSLWDAANASYTVLQGQTWLNAAAVDGTATPRPKEMAVLSVVTAAPVMADRLFQHAGAWLWKGQVAELVFYNRPLGAIERKAVEDYLARKYALYVPQVAAPVASPGGQRFSTSTTVTLTSATPGAVIRYTLDGSDPGPASPAYDTPLTLVQTATLKARAFRPGHVPSTVVTEGFIESADFSPSTVGEPLLWVRADAGLALDAAGRVNLWKDQSEHHNDLAQTTLASQPVLIPGALGGLPILHFDGANDWLTFPTNEYPIYAAFAVLREDAEAPGPRALLGEDGWFFNTAFVPGESTLWDPANIPYQIRDGQTWLNGAAIDGTVTPRPKAMSVLSVMTAAPVMADRLFQHAGVWFWKGDIAELVLYDHPLSATQRKAVEDYLSLKYGVYAGTAAAPEATPNGGQFTDTVTVTLRTATPGGQVRYTLDGSDPSAESELYAVPLELATTTTLKARAFRAGMTPSAPTVVTFVRSADFSPASVSGLKAWLRSDAGLEADSAGRVAAWRDQSGGSNDLTQGVLLRRPVLGPNAMNGLPVLHFDGTNDWLAFPTNEYPIYSVFAVLREDADATGRRALLGEDGWFFNTALVPGESTLWDPSAGYQVLNGQTWLNGVAVDGTVTPRPKQMSVLSVVTTSAVMADRLFQNGDTWFWKGDIAELVLYDRPLTNTERKAVEDHLALKYAAYVGTAATPDISPSGGLFTDSVTVTLTSATPGAEIRYTLDGSEPTTSSNVYSAPFTLTQGTVVKAKAFRAGMDPSVLATATFVKRDDFSPARLTGLSVWAKADVGVVADAAGRVSRWDDQSGAGNYLGQGTLASQPLLQQGVANGYPVLRFDGENDWLSFPTNVYPFYTVFAVLREDADATGPRALLGEDGYWQYTSFLPGESTLWDPGGVGWQVRNGQTWLNGAPIDGTVTGRPKQLSVLSVVTAGPVMADRFFQTYWAAHWKGDVAELVIYNRPLTDAERKSVEDYLALKYATHVATAGAPQMSPNGGLFAGSVTVSLATPTPGAEIRYTLDGSEPAATSTPYTEPFALSATTTVKARAFREGMNPSPVSTVTFTSAADTSPATVSGLVTWVRADSGLTPDAAGRVAVWKDATGAANDLAQGALASQPVLVPGGMNGYPVLHFDGSNDWMALARNMYVSTVFAVLREDADATGARALLGEDGWNWYTQFAPGNTTLWDPANVGGPVQNGQTWLSGVPVDGTVTPRPKQMAVLSVVTTSPVLADRLFQNAGVQFWKGDLAELILYNRPLTDAERKAVEDHLALKYAAYVATAAAPQISPNGGLFAGSVTVSLATSTPGAEIRYTLDGSEPAATSTPYTEPFELGATTTVKARAFREGMNPSPVSMVTFTSAADTSPATVSGLVTWVRADSGLTPDAAGRVAVWRDVTGAANDLTQGTLASQPVVVRGGMNGYPVLHFDGSNDWMALARNMYVSTVFAVLREDTDATGARALLGEDGWNWYTAFVPGASTLWDPNNVGYQIRDGQTWLSGAAVDGTVTPRPKQMAVLSVVTTSPVLADRLFQNAGVQFWKGDLAELILYNRPLTDGERKAVEDHLVLKYATQNGTAGAPQFSPSGGGFTGSVAVSLSTPTPGAEIRYTLDRSDPTESSASYSGPFDVTATTTVKAKAFRTGMNASPVATATFTSSADFSPAAVSGLLVWASADAGVTPNAAGRVAVWKDQSGGGRDLGQGSFASQPMLVPGAVNGLPVLRFDGTNDWMGLAGNLGFYNAFAVLREDADATGARALFGEDGYWQYTSFYPGASTIWDPSQTSGTILQGQTWLNGEVVDGRLTPRPKQMSVLSLVPTGAVAADRLFQNAGWGFWKGELAELVLFNRPLSEAERKSVEDYLAAKWGVYSALATPPQVTPNGGLFTGSVTVTMSTVTAGGQIRYTLDGSDPTLDSVLYTAPLVFDTFTVLKARTFGPDGAASRLVSVSFADNNAAAPQQVAGLSLWVTGEAGVTSSAGGAVSRWADQSGNGNDLVQSDGISRPRAVENAANGRPAIQFDGSDDALLFSQRLTHMRTVFWVIRENPSAPNAYRFLLTDAQNYDFHSGDAHQIWSGSYAQPAVLGGATRVNGVSVDGTNTQRPQSLSLISLVTTGDVTADSIGRDRIYGSRWWGDLAELIVYDRPLTDGERETIEIYLAAKYALPLYLPPVGAPTVDPSGGRIAGSQTITIASVTPGSTVHYTVDGSEATEAAPVYAGSFDVSGTTTIRARAFLAGRDPSRETLVTLIADSEFTPSSVPNLALWVRADAGVSGSDTVAGWQDQSSAGNSLGQGNSRLQPQVVFDSAAGRPLLRFDGVDDTLSFTTRLSTIRTVFWVLRRSPAMVPGCTFLLGDSYGWDFHSPCTTKFWHPYYTHWAVINGQTRLNGAVIDGTGTDLPLDLSVVSLVTTSNVNADAFSRDRTYGRSWWGDLGELIIYDRALSAEEVHAVEQYLADRYQVTLAP